MLGRLLSSNWVAVPAIIVAAASVGLLYSKGRILEAAVAAGALVLAVILIILGGRRRSDEDLKG
jgi:hypothetical protein